MIRDYAKQLVARILTAAAKRYCARVQPKIVCIMGDKTRSLVHHELQRALSASGTVRVNPKGYTASLGVPLSVLGLRAGFSSWYKWMRLLGEAYSVAARGAAVNYIVLEIGYDYPDHIAALAAWLRPKLLISSDTTVIDQNRAAIQTFTETSVATMLLDIADIHISDVTERTDGTRYILEHGNDRFERHISRFGMSQVYADALVFSAMRAIR